MSRFSGVYNNIVCSQIEFLIMYTNSIKLAVAHQTQSIFLFNAGCHKRWGNGNQGISDTDVVACTFIFPPICALQLLHSYNIYEWSTCHVLDNKKVKETTSFLSRKIQFLESSVYFIFNLNPSGFQMFLAGLPHFLQI